MNKIKLKQHDTLKAKETFQQDEKNPSKYTANWGKIITRLRAEVHQEFYFFEFQV